MSEVLLYVFIWIAHPEVEPEYHVFETYEACVEARPRVLHATPCHAYQPVVVTFDPELGEEINGRN